MIVTDFPILDKGPVSKAFLERKIRTFAEAANYLQQLKYGRNENKTNLLTVFMDNCGTCSTKHALLKSLADEQCQADYKLMMGIYKMNAGNTHGVGKVLNQYQLNYIPEAHNYLRIGGQVLDYTRKGSNANDFLPDLLEETEIQPHQITDYKVAYHKQFLGKWLFNNNVPYNKNEIWAIREACITALQQDTINSQS